MNTLNKYKKLGLEHDFLVMIQLIADVCKSATLWRRRRYAAWSPDCRQPSCSATATVGRSGSGMASAAAPQGWSPRHTSSRCACRPVTMR